MSIIEKKENKPEIQEDKVADKKDEVFYRVYPDMTRKINRKEKEIEFEISLPGVKKEDISLKALDEFFVINARRDHLEYSANQYWGDEIIPDQTTAHYENGLLRVSAKIFDPMSKAQKVAIK